MSKRSLLISSSAGCIVGILCTLFYQWFNQEHVHLASVNENNTFSALIIWKREFPLCTVRSELLVKSLKGKPFLLRVLLAKSVDIPLDVQTEFSGVKIENRRVELVAHRQIYKGPTQFTF